MLRPGGVAGACVWNFNEGMQMLRAFWDAALTIDPESEDEARTMRFGGVGETAELLAAAGFTDVVETTLTVSTTYADFDELWAGFLLGIGPAGSHCVSLAEADRARLRAALSSVSARPPGRSRCPPRPAPRPVGCQADRSLTTVRDVVVDVLRRFNRSYTQRIGVLDESYLDTGRPLGPSRLLFEIGADGRPCSSCGGGWGSTRATSAGCCANSRTRR